MSTIWWTGPPLVPPGSHIAGRIVGFLEGEAGSTLAVQLLPLPLEPLDRGLVRELLPVHLGQNHCILPWRRQVLRNPALSPPPSDPQGPGLALLPQIHESSSIVLLGVQTEPSSLRLKF